MDITKHLKHCLSRVPDWGPAELSVVAPIMVHWTVALLYECFDAFKIFQQYKLLQPEEFSKNKVTKLEVVRGVLVNQGIILTVGFLSLALEPDLDGQELNDPLGITQYILRLLMHPRVLGQSSTSSVFVYALVYITRVVVAIFLYDTWQYWVHLSLHHTWAYRRIHIWHHLLNAPWSYAATYVHPLESLLLDAIGPMLTCMAVGLGPWERVLIFTLSVIKTLNDHSGYRFPWDPVMLLGRLTGCDIVYHTVHHQYWGIKTNYALWFTFWDRWMNTMNSRPDRLNLQPRHADLVRPEGPVKGGVNAKIPATQGDDSKSSSLDVYSGQPRATLRA